MSKTKLLYRADGGHPVGMGHIMRFLRVTRELSKMLDLEALLVTRKNRAVEALLHRDNPSYLHISWIPAVEKAIIPVLGVKEFIDTAKDFSPDVIVVDALDTPEEDMKFLSSVGAKIAVLDDRGPGRLYADLVSNFLVRDPDRSELKNGTKLIEGPEYAPLDEHYIGAAEKRKAKEPEEAKVVPGSLVDYLSFTDLRISSGHSHPVAV